MLAFMYYLLMQQGSLRYFWIVNEFSHLHFTTVGLGFFLKHDIQKCKNSKNSLTVFKHYTCQFFPEEIIRNYFFYFSKKIRFTRVLLIISRIQTMDVKLVSKLPFVFSFIFCVCMWTFIPFTCTVCPLSQLLFFLSLALFIWPYHGFCVCMRVLI